MPTYKIHGASKKTGEDQTIRIDAGSEDAAIRQASKRGVMVSRVEEGRKVPRYFAMELFGAVHLVSGVILAVIGGLFIINTRGDFALPLGLVSAGLMQSALGSSIYALRDIARNSF